MSLKESLLKDLKRLYLFLDLVILVLRTADLDQCNEASEQNVPASRGFSPKLSTSAAKPQLWAILDGLWLILSSTYLLYVSLFLWLSAVVSSFFYFQVRIGFISKAQNPPFCKVMK